MPALCSHAPVGWGHTRLRSRVGISMRKWRLASNPDHGASFGLGVAGLTFRKSPQAPEKAPFLWLGTWEFHHWAQVRQPQAWKGVWLCLGLCSWAAEADASAPGTTHTGGEPRPRSACGRRPWYRWPAGEEAASSTYLVQFSYPPRPAYVPTASPQLSPWLWT